MPNVLQDESLAEEEKAIIAAFDGKSESSIVEVIDAASGVRPAALIREAYWNLVTIGRLVPAANGRLRLVS